MRQYYFILPLLFLVSCAGTGALYITEDEFTKEKNVSMEARYNAEESAGLFEGKYFLLVTYVKQLGKDQPVTMNMKLRGFTEDPGQPNVQAMLKINNTTYSLPLLNPKVEIDYIASSTVPTHRTVTVSSQIYWRMTAKAMITKELEDILLTAKDCTIRFYAGTTPVTVKLPAKDLMRVKELLAVKGE